LGDAPVRGVLVVVLQESAAGGQSLGDVATGFGHALLCGQSLHCGCPAGLLAASGTPHTGHDVGEQDSAANFAAR
jgi:hypothetical protein